MTEIVLASLSLAAVLMAWSFWLLRQNRRLRRQTGQIRTLHQAVEQSPVSIVITNTTGDIEYVNRKFIDLTGYSFQEAVGQNPRILKSGFQTDETYQEMWQLLSAGQEWRGEFHNRKKNGDYYWESASISPIFDELGQIHQLLAVKEDITERKRLESELQMQARTDVLTGIHNRRFFMDRIAGELERNQRYPGENVFLMLDIDHFKSVNDRFGHSFGDLALQLVAGSCQQVLRSSDILGRIGGEEFAVFLVATGYAEALNIAERLRQAVEEIELRSDDGSLVPLRVSIGMTVYRAEDTLSALLSRSDEALYLAKNSGRNRVVHVA